MDILVREAIDIVVTDVMMPDMGGDELYRRARESGHCARFLFCSGNIHERGNLGCGDDPTVACLNKPFDIDELAIQVRSLLDRRIEHGGNVSA
jgi:DNA-binding response OmpR family regulator